MTFFLIIAIITKVQTETLFNKDLSSNIIYLY